jgi:hypothetical protein
MPPGPLLNDDDDDEPIEDVEYLPGPFDNDANSDIATVCYDDTCRGQLARIQQLMSEKIAMSMEILNLKARIVDLEASVKSTCLTAAEDGLDCITTLMKSFSSSLLSGLSLTHKQYEILRRMLSFEYDYDTCEWTDRILRIGDNCEFTINFAFSVTNITLFLNIAFPMPTIPCVRSVVRQRGKLCATLGFVSDERGTTIDATKVISDMRHNGWRNPINQRQIVQVMGDAFRSYRRSSFTNVCVRILSPLSTEVDTSVTNCRHV